jgi:RHS repeat-associated protein
MNTALQPVLPEVLPLASSPQLTENSRQGFGPVVATMRWASGWVISSTALGIKGSLYDGDAGSRSPGKERDAESGYDYFGARYYSSSVGRFMSPDWSVKIEPVPYAKLGNPQSLNLFSYVLNNPIALADPDGHELPGGDAYNSMAGQALWAYLTGGNQIAAMQNLAQQQSSTSTSTTNINSRAQAQYNNDVPIIAKQLGVSTDEVLDSVHIDYDANGRAVVIGGHVNMTVDDGSDAQAALAARLGPGPHGYNENPATGEGQGSEFSRLGTTPSVHLDNGLVHVDRFNAGAWGGLGVVPHFFYDVVYGGMHGSTALLPY